MTHKANPTHLPPVKSADEYEREIARLKTPEPITMRKVLTSLGFAAGLILLMSYTAVAVGLLTVTLVADQVCELIDRH